MLQTRRGNAPNFKTAVSVNVSEVVENGSQEHIVENGGGIRCETAVSVHSSSTAGVDNGVTFHAS